MKIKNNSNQESILEKFLINTLQVKRTSIRKLIIFFLFLSLGVLICYTAAKLDFIYLPIPLLVVSLSTVVTIYLGQPLGSVFLISFFIFADYIYYEPIGQVFGSHNTILSFLVTTIIGMIIIIMTFFLQNLVRKLQNQKEEAIRLKVIADTAKEDALRAKVIADAANKSRDEMLGIISHELKNPLTAMLLTSSLIQRIVPKEEAFEKLRDLIKTLDPSINRMNNLVSDLLDVTRIEARHPTCEKKLVSLQDIIQEVVGTHMAQAEAKHIQMQNEIAPDCEEVFCDPIRTIQILSNLISNAIKFMDKGGRLRIHVEKRNHCAEISVADTGVGIRDQDLPHVFEKFWQQKDSEHKGTGLGLAIAKGLAEAQGGKMWVKSQYGTGTTFYFTLLLPEHVEKFVPVGQLISKGRDTNLNDGPLF